MTPLPQFQRWGWLGSCLEARQSRGRGVQKRRSPLDVWLARKLPRSWAVPHEGGSRGRSPLSVFLCAQGTATRCSGSSTAPRTAPAPCGPSSTHPSKPASASSACSATARSASPSLCSPATAPQVPRPTTWSARHQRRWLPAAATARCCRRLTSAAAGSVRLPCLWMAASAPAAPGAPPSRGCRRCQGRRRASQCSTASQPTSDMSSAASPAAPMSAAGSGRPSPQTITCTLV